MVRGVLRIGGIALFAAAAAALAVVALAAGAGSSTPPICGAATRPPPATYDHVIWIWMENSSYRQIVGSGKAPYIDSLARGCGLATNYSAVAHPSLPNYIAASSGGTQGITDDDPPSSHPIGAVSLFEQAGSAASYEENMPGACRLTDSGAYLVRHNPAVYYTHLRATCAARNLPLGAFAHALAAGTLPRFSFVTPNRCHDMHACPVGAGDAWLRTWIPAITATPSYRAGKTVVFVAWDEDDGSASNRVPLLVVSRHTAPGTRNATAFTHYSLLRTTEELLGLRTRLGNAATAASMRAAFGL